MYSEVMECYQYEDLSLFNGDLLLEDVSFPVVAAPSGQKDGLVSSEAVPKPKISVQLTLAHPQNGSQDLGLQDLLAVSPSPTQDLPDPFGQSSAWFDTKTDLLDLLTGVESPAVQVSTPQQVQVVTQQNVAVTPSVIVPDLFPAAAAADNNLESLETIQTLLMSDVPLSQDVSSQQQQQQQQPVMVPSPEVAYTPESLQDPSDAAMDILEELNEACLEQLLSGVPEVSSSNTASLLDNPVLSPVSADDIESLLSSSPTSPTDSPTLSSLFSSFTQSSGNIEIETVDTGVLSIGPVRSVREKTRPTPYTLGSSSSLQSPAASSPRKAKTDRRERKKEQNRTAALRYREKKRGEQDTLQQEVDELVAKNTKLRGEVDSVEKEIRYLKDLMAEVQKAKAKMKKAKSGGAF